MIKCTLTSLQGVPVIHGSYAHTRGFGMERNCLALVDVGRSPLGRRLWALRRSPAVSLQVWQSQTPCPTSAVVLRGLMWAAWGADILCLVTTNGLPNKVLFKRELSLEHGRQWARSDVLLFLCFTRSSGYAEWKRRQQLKVLKHTGMGRNEWMMVMASKGLRGGAIAEDTVGVLFFREVPLSGRAGPFSPQSISLKQMLLSKALEKLI